ncbi:MAG: hypothetical protein IJ446_10735 [Oscillospiraceae bacterium]|nr:hypothetical protein [Oscillospiraceae bacterium]
MKAVRFVIDNNNNYYRLELAKALLNFTEYDFTFFWEQCISAGKTAHKTGRLPQDIMNTARNSAARCHPYVEACLGSSFDCIAVDCIIAYICSSEHIGLEELWARCISPKNNYESTIFRRISEYKTGRAVNQWVNIVRMVEYARKKMNFIYDCNREEPLTADEIKARKDYFDMAFSVAANELGYYSEDVPYVRRYTPALMPDVTFKMVDASKRLYNAIKEDIRDATPTKFKGRNKLLGDQNAMEIFEYIKDLKQPEAADMRFISDEIAKAEQSVIYYPTGFKGIIDLEFDLMAEEGIYLDRCRNCGRFFVHSDEYRRPYCGRVTASGKTCRRIDEEYMAAIARAEAEKKAYADAAAKAAEEAARKAAEEEARREEQRRAEEEAHKKALYTVPEELEKRSEKLYNSLYRRIGKIIDEAEFREWSQYLSNLKKNVRNGEATVEQLEEFMESAEKMYEDRRIDYRLRKNKSEIIIAEPVEENKPPENKHTERPRSKSGRIEAFAPQRYDRSNKPVSVKKQLSDAELYRAAAEAGLSLPNIDTAAVLGNLYGAQNDAQSAGKEYKPFEPKRYSSLYDAMLDEMGADIRARAEQTEEKAPMPYVPPARVIRKPQWEKVSRDSIYSGESFDNIRR